MLHDSSAGQSVVPLQPHEVPFSHTWPTPEVVQSLHPPPVAPHALPAVPATHLEPEQHPPLHAVVLPPQAVEQVWVVVLHAWSDGQSVGALHPQLPPERHACPAPLLAQLAHTVPLPPHTAAVVPG